MLRDGPGFTLIDEVRAHRDWTDAPPRLRSWFHGVLSSTEDAILEASVDDLEAAANGAATAQRSLMGAVTTLRQVRLEGDTHYDPGQGTGV